MYKRQAQRHLTIPIRAMYLTWPYPSCLEWSEGLRGAELNPTLYLEKLTNQRVQAARRRCKSTVLVVRERAFEFDSLCSVPNKPHEISSRSHDQAHRRVALGYLVALQRWPIIRRVQNRKQVVLRRLQIISFVAAARSGSLSHLLERLVERRWPIVR